MSEDYFDGGWNFEPCPALHDVMRGYDGKARYPFQDHVAQCTCECEYCLLEWYEFARLDQLKPHSLMLAALMVHADCWRKTDYGFSR